MHRSGRWLVLSVVLAGCAPGPLELRWVEAVTRQGGWIGVPFRYGDIESADPRELPRIPTRVQWIQISYNQLMDDEASREHLALETLEGVPIDYELRLIDQGLALSPPGTLEPGTLLRLWIGAEVTSWWGHTQGREATAWMLVDPGSSR